MMKKAVFITSFTFFVLFSRIVTAIDWIEINGSNETVVSQVGQNFLLKGNVSSPGAKLACSFFLDVNYNKKLDSIDKLVDFYLLTDGIGNIIDQSTKERIPGDEAKQAGVISTTLFTDVNQCPPSSQNWIVRAVDENQSEAFAYIKWDVKERDCVVSGKLKNAPASNATYVVYAVESGFPENSKIATVNSLGKFQLYLEPNDWQIFAETAVYPFAPSLSQQVSLHKNKHVENLDIMFPGQDYFSAELIEDLRTSNSDIILENYSDPQTLLTGERNKYFSDYEFVYRNVDTDIEIKETNKISVTGLVLIGPETPAQNVNIVARHEWEKGPKGYLFTTTNKEGRFRLETEIEGDWQIGVACEDFDSHPGIQFCYLSEDRNISNLIFNLLPKPRKMLPAASDFRASLNSK